MDPAHSITQYGHRAWRVGDSGLGSQPWSIAQTADGYIWVGVNHGLLRFDGINFSQWMPPNGTSLHYAMDLFGAADGALFIGSIEGLMRMSHDQLSLISAPLLNPGPFVQDKSGVVWLTDRLSDGGRTPLCSWQRDKFRCYGVADGVACNPGNAVALAPDGAIWIAGEVNGLCRRGPNGEIAVHPFTTSPRPLTALALMPDHSVVVGSSTAISGSNLMRFDQGRWSDFTPPGLQGHRLSVSTLLEDRQGSLWIGTASEGLFRVVSGRVDHFSLADGLTSDNVSHIIEDREGLIWVTTTRGVDQFRDLAATKFTAREGLSGDSPQSVSTMSDGSVWLPNDRAIDVIRGTQISHIPYRTILGPNRIGATYADDAGHLWAATPANLSVYDGERFHLIKDAHGNDIRFVRAITEDTSKDIWVAGSDESQSPIQGVLRKIHNGKVVETIPAPAEASRAVIDQIASDGSGGLWVGVFRHGLFRLRRGLLKRVQGVDANAAVIGLMSSAPDEAWVATNTKLIWLKDGRSRSLSRANGLPCDTPHDTLFDASGALWIFTPCGLAKVSPDELKKWEQQPKYSLHATLFDPVTGMSGDFSGYHPMRGADGRLWFTTLSDIRTIDPKHFIANGLAPPVTVQRVVADHKEYTTQDRLVLPKLTRDVEIDYAGLSFVRPEALRFRYRLQGRDRRWTDAGSRRQAFYSDLLPGSYRFQVTACNENGICNETEAKQVLIIPAAWYQTLPFKLACALSAFAIILIIVRWRLQAYAERTRLKFDERLQERARVARDLHDTLMQTVLASKLVADDAKKISADPLRLAAALDQLSEWLSRAAEEGRAAVDSLRTSSTDNGELGEAFHLAALEARTSDKPSIRLIVTGQARELHPVAREEVFRIGCEAIRNVCLHAHATTIAIELSHGRAFSLRVIDNGQGIPEQILGSGKPGHFGLAGMRERSARLRAKLSIKSSGSGVVVWLSVPGAVIYQRNGLSKGLLRLWSVSRSRSD